ncbi:disease resistance protein RUN1-like [Trifolium pratense]|uniref:disease resistance protein RUN1-like n=1 Tax=Trifolium pratense TaxID=57577 RepID=UPI001E697662|nr:disease resistance protein RUN1-like [Trifolium pratense]
MAKPQSFSSSFSYGFIFDVFLSFRGTDTRYGFIGNIYKALREAGIHTFIDDKELHGGDEITPALVKAIEESRIFIPVFSVNYASSSFCLDELVHIIHCFKTKGCLVLPIFYDVEPTHVRHQTGSYGEAIAKHEVRFQNNKEKYNENMKRMHKWKMALNQAAHLSGHHFNPRSGYEYEFIPKIVKYVSNKINRPLLHVVDYPVGLQRRVLKVNSLLEVGCNDEVKMLGIYGPGGMGKTTLARAVYNGIADQFECVCFLHNVRENSAIHGLEDLQKDFLSKTVGLDIKLGDSSEGIPIIKQRIHRKKVLLILDDVDELMQLQVLAGGLDWFSAGSRVIVTTRDKHLLASHDIEVTYEIDEFDKGEALEFLRWKAFKSKQVDSSYENILNRAVNYASGFPLALEVLGSNLFRKPIEKWNSLLDQYEKIPNKKIQKILKVSFDALDENEQSVFLDIACCFKGYHLKEVEDILCAHYGRDMTYHIGVLVEKSLVKIIEDTFHMEPDCVVLHDLIEDMGKEIVRQESPKEPGKRSRLWFHEDIFQVFEANSETNQVEIIHLSFSPPDEIVEWKGDELKKMKNLKTLVVVPVDKFFFKPHHLPNSLRVLKWRWYPSQSIPSDFCPKNLSIFELPKNDLTSFQLANSLKTRIFIDLKVLHLDESEYLTQINDISSLQSLEEFSFQRCHNLSTIHDSIGFLNKLKILNAKGCSKLRSFPPILLPSLQKLELSYCQWLKKFPEILGKIENIETIHFTETLIEELPDSFQNFTGLHTLAVFGYGMLRLPSSILMMPKLLNIYVKGYHVLLNQIDKSSSMVSSNVKSLVLNGCYKLQDESLPIILKWFANVTELNLSNSNFTILPECIKEHQSLWSFNLEDCKYLQEIRGTPPNLKWLSALNCKSLSSSCRRMLLNQELHKGGGTMFCLPGIAVIPEWFEYKNRGSSISFWFRDKLPSIALFCTTEWICGINCACYLSPPTLIINGDACALDDPCSHVNIYVERNHTYLFHLQLEDRVGLDEAVLKNQWNHAKVTYTNWTMKSLFKKSRIHILKQESSMRDFQFEDDDDDDDVVNVFCDDTDDDDDDDDDDVFYDVDDDNVADDDDVFYDVDDVLDDVDRYLQ